MGIRFIITDANEDDFTIDQNVGRDLGCIFFATDDVMEGINLKYDGQYIEHIAASRSHGFATYKFSPSNVILELSEIEVSIRCGGIRIHQFMIEEGVPNNTNDLKDFLAALIAIQANAYKNNLQSVKKVGSAKSLPENVEGRIGTFLSGKTGALITQENKLNQNMGISLAPRIKRKTRKLKGRKGV